MAKEFRNFKIVFRNLAMKNSVELKTFHSFTLAHTYVLSRLKSLGYESRDVQGGEISLTIFAFPIESSWYKRDRLEAVQVDIINLHAKTKRKREGVL